MNDFRTPKEINEDHARADTYARQGSVQHFLLRMGFMPSTEEEAEGILTFIIREYERLSDGTEK